MTATLFLQIREADLRPNRVLCQLENGFASGTEIDAGHDSLTNGYTHIEPVEIGGRVAVNDHTQNRGLRANQPFFHGVN